MQQNVTLKLDKQLLRSARFFAMREKKSLSRLMTEALSQIVRRSSQYERSREKALLLLRKGWKMGGGPYTSSREELHQRG